MNAIQPIEPAAPVFPPIYGMILNLNGRAVDGYEEGDVLEIDTRFLPDVGDLVCVHLRNGHCYMMTTEMALPAKMWSQMPYRENPDSEVHALFVGRVLGDPDPRLRTLKLEDCWAIHVCTGKLDQEAAERWSRPVRQLGGFAKVDPVVSTPPIAPSFLP